MIRSSMDRSRRLGSRFAFAALFALAACAIAAAQQDKWEAKQIVFKPCKASGIYALGKKAGWTAEAPGGAEIRGEYSYTVKKNNQDVIQRGTLNVSGNTRIEVALNEPAMLYVEVV